MTNKTVEELRQEYINECKDINSGSFIRLGKAMNYIVALEEALQTKWVKLPKLPTHFGRYWVTHENAKGERFVEDAWYGLKKGWMDYIDPNIVAWAEITKPAPFGEENEDRIEDKKCFLTPEEAFNLRSKDA